MSFSKSIITSKRFVEIADHVFSEVITTNDFYNLNNHENFTIFDKNEENILYQINELNIKSNSSIFCTSFMVKDLFKVLNSIKGLENLTLISHQGDDLIDKNIFKQIPNSISTWFSPNINYESENLISLPLGIANFNLKNLNENDFNSDYKKSYFLDKKTKLYINFQKNTNNKERDGIYQQFQNNKWAFLDNPNLDLKDYKNNIQNSSFVISPWGNGIDTHRLWETLYLGSIPITKYHSTYSNVTDLPILFVNNYSDINEDLLDSFLNNNKDKFFNFDKLKMTFWEEKIKQSINENSKPQSKEFFILNSPNVKGFKNRKLIERYKKIVFYYLKKIYK
tara:strand:- start:18230 stop:19240 length:1011 start_codon:yes stop_codon:yes gene_type:complete